MCECGVDGRCVWGMGGKGVLSVDVVGGIESINK